MAMGRWLFLVLFTCVSAGVMKGQESIAVPAHPDSDPVLEHRPAPAVPTATDSDPAVTRRPPHMPAIPEAIPLLVPKGTAIQVALDKEVKVAKVGQPIHGRTVEPIYAFDKPVIPVGAEANGRITKIEDVTVGKRTLDVLDANFTPYRKLEVEFTELILADGKHIPIHSSVTLVRGRCSNLSPPKRKKEARKTRPRKK